MLGGYAISTFDLECNFYVWGAQLVELGRTLSYRETNGCLNCILGITQTFVLFSHALGSSMKLAIS